MKGKIYYTEDHSIFKFFYWNRELDEKLIYSLMHSMKKHGFLERPIIVNADMSVIDGQHRLEAAKRLNIPVCYTFSESDSLEAVVSLNISQKKWAQKDYLCAYSKMGIKSYISLKIFTERYPIFNMSSCIKLLGSGDNAKQGRTAYYFKPNGALNNKPSFADGTWKSRPIGLAIQDADRLIEIGQYYNGYTRTTFVMTMVDLFDNPKFDYKVFINKLRKYGYMLYDCPNKSAYVELTI